MGFAALYPSYREYLPSLWRLANGAPTRLRIQSRDDLRVRVHVKAQTESWVSAQELFPTGSEVLPSENARLLDLRLPQLSLPTLLPVADFDFLVVACAQDSDDIAYVARTRTAVTNQAWAWIATAVVLILAALVIGAWSSGKAKLVGGGATRGFLYLLAGGSGRVSLARSQVLFFSIIVIATTVFVFVRTGELSSLSEDILLLLGIGAVATTGAAVGDNSSRHRLSWDNWIWLKYRVNAYKPLQEQELSLASLVTDAAGSFDIFRFQAVFFSLLTGVSILFAGVAGLGEFTIPEGMLGVLGLSQATYVAAKFVGAPTIARTTTRR
jgi:hypothetical protein